MSGGLIACAVTPHTPRMGVEEQAPGFVRGLIGAARELGEAVRALEPDVVVLHSSHWVSTFNWFVTAHDVHEGLCVADEAPDLIPGLPYRQAGRPEFARALAEAVRGAAIPCGINDCPHYRWDYATYVPLKYMDPEGTLPLVTLPSVLCAGLEECAAVGAVVHETARQTGLRAVFLASCAMSHKLVRGPEQWPEEALQEMDRRLIELLSAGDIATLREWLPSYCTEAVAEMGGRPLNGLLGALGAMERDAGALAGRPIGPYCQSSGSGNATVLVTAA